MYRIITLDGTELGMTDSVLYIKSQRVAASPRPLKTKPSALPLEARPTIS